MASMKTTYDESGVGNKDTLMDVIVNISPEETPMLSTFGKTKAEGTVHETLTDSLATASLNAQVEGSDYSFSKPGTRTRVTSYTQIFVTPVAVSFSQEAQKKAGMESEFAYQMVKASKEHALDIEYSLVNGTGNAGAEATARQLKGVLAWVTTNKSTATADRDLTEDIFNDMLETIWTSGGKPDTVWANGFQKRAISGFTASSTKNVDATKKTLVAAIEVYESDFGRIKVVADRFITASKVVITQTDLWKVAVFRPTKRIEVAQVSSAKRAVIETELTLEARNEAGSGLIENLSTS